MKISLAILLAFTFCLSCQKEDITLSKNTDETFYVEHQDSKMRVQVRGNTLSDKIILTVHGGPGGSSYYISYLPEMKELEQSYAVAYWDQPLAGASQSNRTQFTVDDIAEGLRKVVAVIKSRYGPNKKIILFSESWGGIIATAFLTSGTNQLAIAGWINSDGPHDFNLMDREIVKMALEVGEKEITKGNNIATWTTILNYCRNNNPAGNYAVSQQLNELLGDAENLIDTVVKVDFNTLSIFWSQMKTNNAPFTALGLNLLSNNTNNVEKGAYLKNHTQSVKSITIPLLLIWGKYDFIAPPAVADSLYANVQSSIKQLVILERSGHNGFLQEPAIYWGSLRQFVNAIP